MTAIEKPPVYKISLAQVVALLLATGLTLGLWGMVSAYSLFLGGMISVIPNAYFAHRMFRESGARAMEKVVKNALVGEIVKLAMIAAGFSLVLVLVEPLQTGILFAGFVGTHVLGIFTLTRVVKR